MRSYFEVKSGIRGKLTAQFWWSYMIGDQTLFTAAEQLI